MPWRRCGATSKTWSHGKLLSSQSLPVPRRYFHTPLIVYSCRLQVQNALSRKGKEVAIEKLTKAFEESALVFGLRFKGITVKQMEELRRSLPEEGSSMYVVKNNLLKIAAGETLAALLCQVLRSTVQLCDVHAFWI